MRPPEKRSYQAANSQISTRIAEDGSTIITVSAGAVSIVVSVPESQLAHLFSRDTAA